MYSVWCSRAVKCLWCPKELSMGFHISMLYLKSQTCMVHMRKLVCCRFISSLDGIGVGEKKVQKWSKWWCDEGIWECLVIHNSAKLEVTCSFCSQACISHLGLLHMKPDSMVWLSFSFCLSLQRTCHPSSVVTIYFDRLGSIVGQSTENCPKVYHRNYNVSLCGH